MLLSSGALRAATSCILSTLQLPAASLIFDLGQGKSGIFVTLKLPDVVFSHLVSH